jgi:hypothetical protein
METHPRQALAPEDGAELVRLLNEVMKISRRTTIEDLYLHYRDGDGWRVSMSNVEEGAKTWISAEGPWAGLLDALSAAVARYARNS